MAFKSTKGFYCVHDFLDKYIFLNVRPELLIIATVSLQTELVSVFKISRHFTVRIFKPGQ